MDDRHPVRPSRTALAWTAAVALPLLLLVAVQAGRSGAGMTPPLFAFVQILPVLLLGRWPTFALALLLGGAFYETGVLHSLWETRYLQIFVVAGAVGYLVSTRSRRYALGAAGAALVVEGLAFNVRAGVTSGPLLYPLVAIVVALLAGNTVRQRREYAASLRERAAAQAVTEERLRIARELHDMVAHSIGIIAIQAGVGGRVIDTQPAEARNSLAAIEATSRETLEGLRRMLGALRRAEPGTVPATAALGLADVPRLAAATADAGVHVTVEWRGRAEPLPADLDLSAYRIVQEAVTNVVRHAATPACTVLIDQGERELSIEVVDDGRARPAPGEGFGIAGMRERVALLHGRFTAAPRPEGGFRVAASLPVPPR